MSQAASFRRGKSCISPHSCPYRQRRRLEFLLQEINRETNTIGSKANNAAAQQIVVAMKNEVEKLREQVQNLE